MREINKISESLFEKIRDRFEDVSLGDENAKATQDPEQARFFNFDYIVNGHNHGNITLSVIDEVSLKVYFSKNISKNLDQEERKDWYNFLRELREFAKRNLLTFEPRDITRSTLKHRDIQQQSKADSTFNKDEVIAEGKMWGTSKSSYEDKGPVKIIIRHSDRVDPEKVGDRARKIHTILLQNKDGERRKLPYNSVSYARAMARHVSEGGSLEDDLGQYITEIASEMHKLRPFKHSVRHRMFEDEEVQEMVEAAFEYHGLLKNTLNRMSGRKGYNKIKENFKSDNIIMDDFDIEELKEKFVKRSFDDRIGEALPVVRKAYEMKKQNRFAEHFSNWADMISEGTWALPDSDQKVEDLKALLAQELPVGVDAQNATNALYDLVGSDDLFDLLGELAEDDPEQDARPVITSWLQFNQPNVYKKISADEQPTEPAPAAPAAPAAPVAAEPAPAEEPQPAPGEQPMKEGAVEKNLKESGEIYTWVADFVNAGRHYMDIQTDEVDVAREIFAKKFPNLQIEKITTNWKPRKRIGGEVRVYPAPGENPMKEGTYGAAIPGGTHNLKPYMEHEGDDQVEMIAGAIIRRILNNIGQHKELLMKAGPEGVMNAARDVASFHAPVEELGTSDISIMVREVYSEVGVEYPQVEESVSSPAEGNFEQILNLSKSHEGIVVLGAGGPLSEWIDGIHNMWKKEGITNTESPEEVFSDAIKTTTTGGRTDLVLPFKDNSDLNFGKMAMWRLRFGDCSWLSDYVVNYRSHHGVEDAEHDYDDEEDYMKESNFHDRTLGAGAKKVLETFVREIEELMEDAYDEGYAAGKAGEGKSKNPYSDMAHGNHYDEWLSGWEQGNEQYQLSNAALHRGVRFGHLGEDVEGTDSVAQAVMAVVSKFMADGHSEVDTNVVTAKISAALGRPFMVKDLVAVNNSNPELHQYISSINPTKIKFSTDYLTVKNTDPNKEKDQAQAGVAKMAERAANRKRLGESEYDEEDYDDEEEEDDQGFYVVIANEEDGVFIGMVTKEDGRWYERRVKGKAPYAWGGPKYMSYLKPRDIMSWLHKDFGRHSEVKGPFADQEAAEDAANYMLEETKQHKTYYALKHRKTGDVLSVRKDRESAHDELMGLGDGKYEYKIVKTSKGPRDWHLDEGHDTLQETHPDELHDGQRVYVTSYGETGEIEQQSPRLKNYYIVNLENGQTIEAHFTELVPEDDKPGLMQRGKDKLKSMFDLHEQELATIKRLSGL